MQVVDRLPEVDIVIPIDAEAVDAVQAAPGTLPGDQTLFRMGRVDELADKPGGFDQRPGVDDTVRSGDLVELVGCCLDKRR